MKDDLNFKFIEESNCSDKSDSSSSIADSTFSNVDKNSIRRRLIELDHSINKLEADGVNLKKELSQAKSRLITVMDTLENYKEIDKKYSILRESVDTPLTKLEKSIFETKEMIHFGEKMLAQLHSANQEMRVKEYKLTIGDNLKEYGPFKDNFRPPTESEILDKILASNYEEKVDSEFSTIMDGYRKEKNEYLKMINESIRYYNEFHQRLSKQLNVLNNQATDEKSKDEEKAKEQECITIPDDSQFIA